MREASVELIPVSAIAPNPHNPRTLFDDEPMQILAESIKELGILVPLTVYKKVRQGKSEYVLLDGERRWRCSIQLGTKNVPAIIVEEPSEEQNILTMFHIHNVRESWELMPTALKLKTLMEKFSYTNERKLSELTKLNIATIRRCKILLSYPKRYQNMMLAPPSERWKADFFVELERVRRPALINKLKPWMRRGDNATIDIFVDKYERGKIKAVTDFRKLAETYKASKERGKIKEFEVKFDGFLRNKDQSIDEVNVDGATFAKEAKEIRRSAFRLLSQVQAIDLSDISSDKETISLLLDLMNLIREKLDKALLLKPR